MTAPVEPYAGRVLGERRFELGEGPAYDPAADTAWWFDILGKLLVSHDFASDRLTVHDLPLMASALAFADDGRQVLVTESGLSFRDRHTGALSSFLEIEADDSRTRSNDARVHPGGALWMSTMGKNHEDAAGAIYHVWKGEVRRLYSGLSIPNAICFSPRGDIGYFTDTRQGDVLRVALDPVTGAPVGEPVVFIPKKTTIGNPDGAVVDADGNFWNARWGAGHVDCHTPDGKHRLSLALPAKCTSCPAFVGKDATRLLVTSAYEGLGGEDRRAQPLAGATFLLDHPVKGRFEPHMKL